MLPEQVCRHFRMLPISYDGETLVMAMADPSDAMAQSVAFALTSDPLEVVLAPANQIDGAIDRVYGGLGHASGLTAIRPPRRRRRPPPRAGSSRPAGSARSSSAAA